MGQLQAVCSHSQELVDDLNIGAGQEPVRLNVYDVAGDKRLEIVNDVFRSAGGGAYHAGVEIFGQEWSFGGCSTVGASGVFACEPRKSPGVGRFREAVNLGSTRLTYDEVMSIIESLEEDWMGDEYEFMSRNCCHFCAHLLRELQVRTIPPWVTSLAGTGAALRSGAVAVHEAAHVNAPALLGGVQMSFEAVQKMMIAIDVVLECISAPGVDIGGLQRWEKCIVVKVAPGKPEAIGPLQLPSALRHLDVDQSIPQAKRQETFFKLEWEPPCLFLRKPAVDAPLTVGGALVKQPTYVLLNNSEIGICSSSTTTTTDESQKLVPFLVFKIDRHSTARNLHVQRLMSSIVPQSCQPCQG